MEASFTITITEEDVKGFSNLGYEPTQRHLDIAAELFEEKVQNGFMYDLFHFLLAAKGYAEDEAITGT